MTLYEPKLRKWTQAEYEQAIDLGWFEDQRVELIDGEIFQMPPQKSPHEIGIELTRRELQRVFGPDYWVRVQMTLRATVDSAPEPGLAVVPGAPREYEQKPDAADLIVEVSESTLRFDRDRKAPIYAEMGISDFWILNLIDHQLEVYRDPRKSTRKSDAHYADITILSADESIRPLAKPTKRINVADLLP